MSDTKRIGQKIADARRKVNISQAQLAEYLFISPQAVGKWERGESMPDITTFNRLAEILGVDLNYFSGDSLTTASPTDTSETLVKRKEELPTNRENEKPGWDMSKGNWVDADFSGLKNLSHKFSSSNMQACRFVGSDLSGLLLKRNNIINCDFSGSSIRNSQIQASNLSGNKFNNSDLSGTEITESNIEFCDFTGTTLNKAKFSRSFVYGCALNSADLTGVSLKSGGLTGVKSKDAQKNIITNALWKGTSFIDMQIADLIFSGTMEDCIFEACKFTRIIFRNTIFVNTFFKNNKNLKRVKFVDCRADRMTYEFLKQGQADVSGILAS